jgi:hypothetical protein
MPPLHPLHKVTYFMQYKRILLGLYIHTGFSYSSDHLLIDSLIKSMYLLYDYNRIASINTFSSLYQRRK